MNILSMLARLQSTLGCVDLVHQMVLLPSAQSGSPRDTRAKGNDPSETNLVVGYSSSPKSQTALDLTLWIAHQTRLATGKQVTVQVVYVAEDQPGQDEGCDDCLRDGSDSPVIPVFQQATAYQAYQQRTILHPHGAFEPLNFDHSQPSPIAVAEVPSRSTFNLQNTQFCKMHRFDKADRILWQARCLAEEWRGSLKTHLRFGQVARELQAVVHSEAASLLILGCDVPQHPLVRALENCLPCPVLGIPTTPLPED